jgi:hypothetical protein
MTQPGQYPDVPRGSPAPVAVPDPGSATGPGRAPARLRTAVLALIATAAASALLGLLTGLIWSAVAPRALLIVQSRGVAYVANAETSAFIAAEGWFCLLTAAGGVICGLAGYLLAVRRYGAAALTGLLLGGVAASALAMWVGQQQGLAGFRSGLAASPPGTRLSEPLSLGGHGALALWPLFVGLLVGSIEVIGQSIERRRAEAAARALPAGTDGPAGIADPGAAS